MKQLALIFGFLWCLWLPAAEVLPARPTLYFNDYANAVSPATAQQLNQQLSDFERETSSQLVVAVYPRMASSSSLEDYTHRVATDWQVGQKDKRNGVVLFVFLQEHKMRIEVGYGLEGALPDAICKRIIEDEIAPRFRSGDMAGGLKSGVNAIIAATKGEYKGTGQTAGDRNSQANTLQTLLVIIVIVIFVCFILGVMFRGATSYDSSGRRRRSSSSGGWFLGTGSSWGGGWSSGGGGSGGGGFSSGGGFSGGGGSFGGGGASGSW